MNEDSSGTPVLQAIRNSVKQIRCGNTMCLDGRVGDRDCTCCDGIGYYPDADAYVVALESALTKAEAERDEALGPDCRCHRRGYLRGFDGFAGRPWDTTCPECKGSSDRRYAHACIIDLEAERDAAIQRAEAAEKHLEECRTSWAWHQQRADGQEQRARKVEADLAASQERVNELEERLRVRLAMGLDANGAA